jgi:CheY-like chemotaxis protein
VPHTLLLADDSVTIQRVIELTFADEDVKVIAVSDGDQAIAQLEASPPDIVLADIGMPGRNGYEVAQYIRQTPHLAHIPVVLLTGAFEPVDQARAAEAGCDGVLAKPFEPQLVISRVKELLARPRRVPALIDADLAPPASTAGGQWPPPIADQSLSAASAAAPPAPHGELND